MTKDYTDRTDIDGLPLTISGLPILNADGTPLMTKGGLTPTKIFVDELHQIVVEKEIQSIPPLLHRLVIIHDEDADGIAAAWCINHHYVDDFDSVLLIPQRAGINEIPEGLTEEDEVFLVDRTYPWPTLLTLSQQVFTVTVIDHHKSALKDYSAVLNGDSVVDAEVLKVTDSSLYLVYGNLTVQIDIIHSACMLAWIDDRPAIQDLDAPWFIKYIEDRDIWKWKLPDSKEINAGMYYLGHTFENYNTWYRCEDKGYNIDYIKQDYINLVHNIGVIVTNTQLKIIKSIAHGPTVQFQDVQRVLVENLQGTPEQYYTLNFAIVCCPFSLISDLGDYILNYHILTGNGSTESSEPESNPELNQVDVVLCYNQTSDGYVYSIRSKYDMLWLAKLHGGGGHPNACGFSSKIPPDKILYPYEENTSLYCKRTSSIAGT